MKLLKKTLVATTLTILSAYTLAGQYVPTSGSQVERYGTRTFETKTVQTKSEAFQLGLTQLRQLSMDSPVMLSKKLKIQGLDVDKRKVHLNDDGYVTVIELMNTQGQLSYKGVVEVSYHYAERERNN
ncbi:DUF3316 domain-containing protein [Vibrio sp. HN007]|jgi:hypothetical protein|uniref:DUF3316 domain-containing protein n=1 Tax=Vibrio iocasae TaxID=3098914 RepID=UPI00314F7019